MKPSILFSTIALAAVLFSSCSSAYRAGQTPDDVYFSPTKEAPDEYVQTQDRRDSRMYEGSDQYYEDRYLRMRVANRGTWSALDDYYFNSPYGYNSFYYSDPFMWNSPWNNYWRWNSFYNPYSSFGWYGGGYYGNWAGGGWNSWGGWGGYHPGVVVIGGGNHQPRVVNSRPVAFNRNTYVPNNNNSRIRGGNVLGNNYQNSNSNRLANSYRGTNSTGYSNYNNSNSNSGRYNSGNYNYDNNSRSNSNSYRSESSSSNNSRSYTPSSSSSSSSSGSSGGGRSSGGGGVSRPGRN